VRNRGQAGFAADLFAIQRLAMLLNIDLLAHERWHTTGARYLRSLQLKDGSFEEMGSDALNGPVRTTCTALLFLARATPPVTERE
jgi:prenyltransferase beta subunit